MKFRSLSFQIFILLIYCLFYYLVLKHMFCIEFFELIWKKTTSSASSVWMGFSNSSVCPDSWKNSLVADSFSFTVLIMVCGVVLMVSLYSEVYLEHYNSYKFLFLMLAFFFSMVLLTTSKSILILMTGWDWLGVTSIFLIMFYPNKLTLFNSYLTMMFNRFGDIIMMGVLCLYLLDPHSSYFLLSSSMVFPVSILVFCAFTKSAQFPVSSWLPAAMSAPTPISAMVHSSTLVTAGLCIVFKVFSYLELFTFPTVFLFFSLLSFLMGGFMAKEEPDFKKIVAFSTMSQISMVMCFCFLGLFILGLSHMFFHAFFKTLLFCCCGTFFLCSFSNQLFKEMTHPSVFLISFLFFSIFSMSGLTFSSSFLSKDKSIEAILFSNSPFLMVVILLGSVLTLIYCSKILVLTKLEPSNAFSSKKGLLTFFVFFSISTLLIGSAYSMVTGLYFCPVCTWEELAALLLIFLCSIFFQKKMKSILMFKYMTLDIFLMKSITFSLFGSVFTSESSRFLYTDVFSFKPKFFSFSLSKLDGQDVAVRFFFYLVLFSLFYFHY